MKNANWIEIFRAGTHTDSAGHTRTFTTADLDRAVASLDPARHEPPLVLGHPATDAPAYGWVAALKREGERLFAAFRDVPDVIRALVDKGRYKKRSIALYPDGRLRHVGLLGAAVPAVQGLADIAAFAAAGVSGAGDSVTGGSAGSTAFRTSGRNWIPACAGMTGAGVPGAPDADGEFSEFTLSPHEDVMNPEEMQKKVAALEAEIKELAAGKEKAEAGKEKAEAAFAEARRDAARKELEGKIGDLIKDGRILPGEKPVVLAFAEALDASAGELEFAAGQGKKPLLAHFFDFLATRPDHGLFREFAAPVRRDPASGAEAPIPYADIMNKV